MDDDANPMLERRRQARERSRLRMILGGAAAVAVVMFFAGVGVGRLSKGGRGSGGRISDVENTDEQQIFNMSLKKN